MKKSLGSFLVTGLGLALLIYTAARSLDFIGLTLPPDKQILAIFGLAALDGGLVFWLISFMYSSHGKQRPIGLVMVIVDFVGIVCLFTLDTLYQRRARSHQQRLSGCAPQQCSVSAGAGK